MRVIAGSLKGRRLEAPTWSGLRPTSDKLRETLFNVLAPRVAGARVLDGYAGTGAVGIEAISRGAAHVTFVERDRRARELIADNLARCGVASGCAIIRAGFDRLGPFDLVLLDPPYEDAPEQALAFAGGLVAPDGWLVLEHAKRQAAPPTFAQFARTRQIARLARTRQIASGDSMLSFYSCPP